MSFDSNDKLLLTGLLPTEASHARLRQLLSEERVHIEWDAIVRRANFHHTAPLLRFNLARIGELTRAPVEIRSALDEASRTWAARQLAYASETTRLIVALNEAGIMALPLKGAALMLGHYYPEAGLRAALDIDLVVDPSEIAEAEAVAERCGYSEIPGRRNLRPRQRLENERNHVWPRRGASSSGGLILELHHRAFHFVKGERDLTFAEIRARAVKLSNGLLLPAPSDLALHLIHHTIVDLQSTHAILRTLADLHFIFTREPHAQEEMKDRTREFGFAGAADLAVGALALIAEGRIEEIANREAIALLLETAFLESPTALSEAARLFEYFDFTRHPMKKIGNLLSLFFTSRSHLEQLYGKADHGNAYWKYLWRPIDLIAKFHWAGLSPGNLRRVHRLRRATSK